MPEIKDRQRTSIALTKNVATNIVPPTPCGSGLQCRLVLMQGYWDGTGGLPGGKATIRLDNTVHSVVHPVLFEVPYKGVVRLVESMEAEYYNTDFDAWTNADGVTIVTTYVDI